MSRCENCGQLTDMIRTVIVQGELRSDCSYCRSDTLLHPNEGAARSRRGADLRKHSGDVVQPSQIREYRQQYGLAKAREHYDDDTLRRYS